MEIDGAAAVVTGGASGLGAATSREMVQAGAKIAIFDINVDTGERLASELGGLFVHCDVADEYSVSNAFLTASKRNGATRLLVNCAGIAPMARIVRRSGPHKLTTFEEVIRVNLTGTFNCTRIVAASITLRRRVETSKRFTFTPSPAPLLSNLPRNFQQKAWRPWPKQCGAPQTSR